MASITKRGERWRAEVRRKGYRSLCKTFGTKAAAEKWARGVEAQMDDGKIVAELAPGGDTTVGKIIHAYRALRESSRPIADTSNEHYQLKRLVDYLGDETVHALTPARLTAFCIQRRDEDGAGPYTCNMDLSKLGTVLRIGGAALNKVFPDVVGAARPTLTHLRLIGGGGVRSRRPTEDELTRILAWLTERKGIAYAEAIAFAAATAMRQGEIVALRVEDIDQNTHTARVMRKHPRLGKKLHIVPILEDAWQILTRQTPTDGRIFALNKQTLSKYFTECCRALSIPDLHFHDLRHEGTSSLFEDGFAIEQVALVTGHADWRNLKRYTNLNPADLTRLEPDIRQSARQRRDSPQTCDPHPGKS